MKLALSIVSLLLLVACSRDDAKGSATKAVVEPLNAYYAKELKPFFDQTKAKASETVEFSKHTSEAVEEFNQTVSAAKSTYDETSRTVGDAARRAEASVTENVRYVRANAPRSQEEANKMVHARGQKFFDWLRGKVDALGKKHQNSLNMADRNRSK